MQDICHREINYLRVSVTDRCNMRCIYCMPPAGVRWLSHGQVLRNEELERLIRASTQAGIRKIRLTGGEPLVRKGLVELVASIANTPLIDDIAITTNGMLLPVMGRDLKTAGLRRVNISLDTLDPGLFKLLTRNGELSQVWRGIETALKLDLTPVKINTVVMRGYNDCEVGDIASLTLRYPLHVRFIELMPVGVSDAWAAERHVAVAEVKESIESQLGRLDVAYRPAGCGPARYFRLAKARGTIGFISAVSSHFCQDCNRLRLTAEGTIRPCLYSGSEIDIKGPLRQGADEQELAGLFAQAVVAKPMKHNIHAGWQDNKRIMSQIGG